MDTLANRIKFGGARMARFRIGRTSGLEMSSPKLFIIEAVLVGALDAGAEAYVVACRRLLSANLRGWRKYADPKDWAMVLEAYGEMLAADYGGMDCDRISYVAEDAMASGDAMAAP